MASKTDLIQHNGKTYRLADLANYMEDANREDVHGRTGTETPQGFWDKFCELYPDEADHLATITPTVEE